MELTIQYIIFCYFFFFSGVRIIKRNVLIIWKRVSSESYQAYRAKKQDEDLDYVKNLFRTKKFPIYKFTFTQLSEIFSFFLAYKYAGFQILWLFLGIFHVVMFSLALMVYAFVLKSFPTVEEKEINATAEKVKSKAKKPKYFYLIRWIIWEPAVLVFWIIAFKHLYIS